VLSSALLAASQRADSKQPSTTVYELRIYHAAPGKLGELLARFRDHTTELFEKHGMKNVAYFTRWTNPIEAACLFTFFSISGEAPTANWKSFQDDPEWKRVKEKSETTVNWPKKLTSPLWH
jgi:hypothetical protein